MPIAWPLIGALVGASLGSDSRWFFGLVVGAFAGFVIAELRRSRARFGELEQEIAALRGGSFKQEPAQAPAASAAKPAPFAPPIPEEPAPWSAPQASAVSSSASPPTPAPSTTAPTEPVAEPAEPSAVRLIREYFTGGNTLVRVGIVILFFGVAFLVRYVAEHTRIPIEFRLTGVAIGALVLLALGWRLRIKRSGYALALQGGGVGILYLLVFAALRIYGLIPPAAAFPLLVLIAAFSALLAILQNSLAFALLGISGGFLAPILASTGQGNHVVLFSYYAVLNAGILAVAWFKAWRPLNVAGFLFTFVIGIAWGALRYRSQLFASTEPFLVLFFVFYVAIAILFALRQPPRLRGYVDGTLVFGTPIVAFGLQAGMLHERPFALAYSALAVSALYLILAWLIHRAHRETMRLLVESFMALGVAFLTLAVPLALDGRWSAATWALEGAALVWIGCRQNRRLPRAAGACLQIAGGIIFWADAGAPYAQWPVLNSRFIGGAMVAIASIFSAGVLHAARQRLARYEILFAPALFFWGLAWWLIAGAAEIDRHVAARYELAALLVFVSLTALLSGDWARRRDMSIARWPALALLPVMALFVLAASFQSTHPFADGGWLAWPAAFAIFYRICRRHEGASGSLLAGALHAGSAWLAIAILSWELAWTIDRLVVGGGSWPAVAWALAPAIALLALPALTRQVSWPFAAHRDAYANIAAAGFAVYLASWSLITNLTLPGDPRPLPYVPLLSPLDVAQAFVLLALLRHWLPRRNQGELALLAGIAFIWLNAALLRTLHYWAGVPFDIDAMWRSTLVQTSFSIFWTLLALGAMLFAARRAIRAVWLTGAGLLIAVIAKLFLIDLSHIGGVERIVSFVGVGILMLVIGYFSPLPPAAKERT